MSAALKAQDQNIVVITGDDAATNAFAVYYAGVLGPLAEKHKLAFRFSDWSLIERMRSDAKPLNDVFAELNGDHPPVLFKLPGRTPGANDAAFFADVWDVDSTKLSPLGAGATPNGALRKAGKLYLLRTLDPKYAELYKQPEFSWKGNSGAKVLTPEKGQIGQDYDIVASDQPKKINVRFIAEDGAETVIHQSDLPANAAFKFQFGDHEKTQAFADAAVAQCVADGSQLVPMGKQTVLKVYDGEGMNAVNQAFQKNVDAMRAQDIPMPPMTEAGGINGNACIVDAIGASYVAKGMPTPAVPKTAVIMNSGYGSDYQALIEAMVQNGIGLDLTQSTPDVARCSGGPGNQYGAKQAKIAQNGRIVVEVDGVVQEEFSVKKNDYWLARYQTAEEAKEYATVMFERAILDGYNHIRFGFDPADPYDAPMVAAVKEVYEGYAARLTDAGVDFDADRDIRSDRDCMIEAVINPPKGRILYAMSNLGGDLLSDFTASWAGSIATCNSVGLTPTGEMLLIEAGTGGTAIDLEEKHINGNPLLYNPTPIAAGAELMLSDYAKKTHNLPLQQDMALLVQARANLVKKGVITPDMRRAAKIQEGVDIQLVDTHEWVAALQGECVALGWPEDAANAVVATGYTEFLATLPAELQVLVENGNAALYAERGR
jgi:isocitrate dehydrogenase